MQADTLQHHFREFIRRFNLIQQGEWVIIAVSGGIDSVVLLDLLEKMKNELKVKLALAHMNHCLRGEESDQDEEFVQSIAKDHGLECYLERTDTSTIAEQRKLSIQETARELRYDFFTRLRVSYGYHKIATAHHADDNTETLLFNVIRGTGVHGMTGIPVKRDDIGVIRPLLFATREQISRYALERQLNYREDTSNRENKYTRNFIRHQLIPQIREHINPNLTATLSRTSELFLELEKFLLEETSQAFTRIQLKNSTDEIILDADRLCVYSAFIQEYLLFETAKKFCQTEIDFATVQSMLKIVEGETGAWCKVSKNAVFYRNRNQLILTRVGDTDAFHYSVIPNQHYEFQHFHFGSTLVSNVKITNNPFVEYIDASTLGNTLVLRSWNEGDWFIPLGMHDKKKLSDFFIDQKVPLFDKHLIPLLVSDENIVWVCGKRLDDRYKITPKTKTILKLEFMPRHVTK
ncbi:MAG: tRNA lysidine(34) synthetase TilS [Ignavibacteriae bacterium]|nr:tRNA lysidine(34) synthetase TilS [Ignavibacteriota bacterium]